MTIRGLGQKKEAQGKGTHESPWTQEDGVHVNAKTLRNS
jgi:hypothetical protein